MTDFTDSFGFNKNTVGYPAHNFSRYAVIETELDFWAIANARSDAGLAALAAGDTLEVLKLPEKAYVLAAGVDVSYAGTDNLTLTLSDGTTDFVDAFAGDAMGSAGSGGASAQFYAAETGLTLGFGVAAPGDLVVKVWVLAVNAVGDPGEIVGTV